MKLRLSQLGSCGALLAVLAYSAQAQTLEKGPPPCDADRQAGAEAGAANGEPASVYLLARYLSTGRCMPGDGLRAISLYKQAAQLGYPPAFYNLGILSAARQDFASAEGYFANGALAGHRGCELQLGILYSLVPPPVGNDSKAFAWLSLTAARNEPSSGEAADRLAVVRRRLPESSMAPAEALAQRLRADYLALQAFAP